MPRGTQHRRPGRVASDGDVHATRATRRATGTTALVVKKSPGRPKGSVVNKETGLTRKQEEIAEAMLTIELKTGLFPASVKDIVDATGANSAWVRECLRRPEFRAYLNKLLEAEGVVLEGAFWRGLALGMQVGDPKILELYAKLTRKITTEKPQAKLTIEVVGPDGKSVLPTYDIHEGEIVEEGA